VSDFIAHFWDWKPKRVHHFKGGFKNTPLESKYSVIVITKAYGAWALYILSLEQASLWKKYKIWWFVMNCFRVWRIHHHLSQLPTICDELFRAWRIHYHLSRNYPQFVMDWFFRAWRIHYHLSRNYPQFVMNCFLGLEEFIIIHPKIIPQLLTICHESF
jgi:hypothetical protein